MPKLLIVEDETPIGEGLLELFEGQGFETQWVADGAKGLSAALEGKFQLILLDLMLPSLDGISILSRIRAAGHTVPVLLLTAKGSESDIVEGLRAGADDYVVKPFGIAELVARVEALLRRPQALSHDRFELCGLVVDAGTSTVEGKDEGKQQLTPREVGLLRHLATHPERALSRAELLEAVWGYSDGTIRTRTVDVHVQQLRAKLRSVTDAEVILTVRGAGYRLAIQT